VRCASADGLACTLLSIRSCYYAGATRNRPCLLICWMTGEGKAREAYFALAMGGQFYLQLLGESRRPRQGLAASGGCLRRSAGRQAGLPGAIASGALGISARWLRTIHVVF